MSVQKTQSVHTLADAIRRHNKLYWEDYAPEISDAEYDRMVESVRALDPNHPVLTELGAPPGKRRHLIPMLSLKKTYDVEGVEDWMESNGIDTVFLSYKIDGAALSLRYSSVGNLEIAATRGDGEFGEDLDLGGILAIRGIPQNYHPDTEVRGEVYLSISKFEEIGEDYSNPRNLAAGILKQGDPQRIIEADLHFLAYSEHLSVFEQWGGFDGTLSRLEDGGFDTVPGVVVTPDRLRSVIDDFNDGRPTLDFEVDGLVIRVLEEELYTEMGVTSHHPRGAIALKYQGDSGITTLRGIEWEVSRTGRINPVAVFEGVELSGAVVTRASLHNLGFISELAAPYLRDDQGTNRLYPGLHYLHYPLSPGAEIEVTRRGGVIPHVERIVEVPEFENHEEIAIPKSCPDCGEPLYLSGDFLTANHSSDCRVVGVPIIVHYCNVLDIKGFGKKVVETLWDHCQVYSPADLHDLDIEDFKDLPRLGEKSGRRLLQQIASARRVRVRDFLRALGIDGLGKKVSLELEKLYNVGCSGTEALEAIMEDVEGRGLKYRLVGVEGIGEGIAISVEHGLRDRRSTYLALLERHVPYFEEEVSSDSQLSGKTILFTGAMTSMTRKEATAKAKASGAAVSGSVSSKLDFLVLGDGDRPRYEAGWRSSKLKKLEVVQASGGPTRLLSESEFLDMV